MMQTYSLSMPREQNSHVVRESLRSPVRSSCEFLCASACVFPCACVAMNQSLGFGCVCVRALVRSTNPPRLVRGGFCGAKFASAFILYTVYAEGGNGQGWLANGVNLFKST